VGRAGCVRLRVVAVLEDVLVELLLAGIALGQEGGAQVRRERGDDGVKALHGVSTALLAQRAPVLVRFTWVHGLPVCFSRQRPCTPAPPGSTGLPERRER
jgi:hypothetical protein